MVYYLDNCESHKVALNGPKWFSGRPTAIGAASGAVAGLVGITPGAGRCMGKPARSSTRGCVVLPLTMVQTCF
jgi:ammonia channel protein AmtB